MKVLFVHDHRFVVWEGEVYSEGKLAYSTWKRFLHGENLLTVAARRRTGDAATPGKMNPAGGENVSFDLIDSCSPVPWSRSRREAQRHLDRCVDDADVVVARLPSSMGGLAARTAHRMGKPLAVEVVSNAFNAMWYYGGIPAKLIAPLLHLRAKHDIRLSDFAVYVTDRYLQSVYPTRCESVVCSDADLIPPPENLLAQRLAHIENKTADEPFRIGFIGSLTQRYKGLHDAFEAIRRLKANHPVRLSVVGSGNLDQMRDESQRLGIQDHIELLGSLTGGQPVLSWLDGMDCYVHPSYTEGLPRSLIEAMSRGLPCVASTVGGIPELLPAEWMHQPGDVGAMVDRILKILSARDMAASAAKANFEAAERFWKCNLEPVRQTAWEGFFNRIKRD